MDGNPPLEKFHMSVLAFNCLVIIERLFYRFEQLFFVLDP